jgi:hypothetical protein
MTWLMYLKLRHRKYGKKLFLLCSKSIVHALGNMQDHAGAEQSQKQSCLKLIHGVLAAWEKIGHMNTTYNFRTLTTPGCLIKVVNGSI